MVEKKKAPYQELWVYADSEGPGQFNDGTSFPESLLFYTEKLSAP